MSGLLFLAEAIESRVASYSCPRGTRGRVLSLRLRRCFHNDTRRRSAALAENEYPERQSAEREPDIELINALKLGPNATAAGLRPFKPTIDRDAVFTPKLDLRNRYTAHRKEKRYGIQKVDPTVNEDLLGMPTTTTVDLSYTEAQSLLLDALRTGDPHVVLHALIQATGNNIPGDFSELLETMPATQFSEMLRCLDPAHFVGRSQRLHMEISPHTAKIMRLPPVNETGYYKTCGLLLSRIKYVLATRRGVAPLCQTDLRYLLRCARATGDSKAAKDIWVSLTTKHGGHLDPDLMSYNYYLGVKCWSSTFHPLMRHSVRVIPYNFAPREWLSPPPKLQGHRVGLGGIKSEISALFWSMVQEGISGDEETFCHMIIAFSREGDLAGIESILSRGWDINVADLMSPNNLDIPPKNYNSDSPFYPSNRLLHTLAHAYGINNAIPTALRLIDYISRHYSLSIEKYVWEELLNWTYVLSRRRKPKVLQDGTFDDSSAMGQLPPEAVLNLWTTVTSEPYNVRPSLKMYDFIISSLLHRQCFGQAQALMELAREQHKEVVKELSDLLVRSNFESAARSKAVSRELSRDITFTHFRVRRNRLYIKKWVRRLLYLANRSFRRNADWQARNLPRVIERWSIFLPNKVRYNTTSGEVQFWTEVMNKNRRRQWQFAVGIPEGKRRRMDRRTGMIKSMESVTTGGKKTIILRTRLRVRHWPSKSRANR